MHAVHVRRTVHKCYMELIGQILIWASAQSAASLLDLNDEG
jgi:hypothetical protein